MAKLTSKSRDALPTKDFAFPKSRSFPLSDQDHYKAALLDAHSAHERGVIKAVWKRMHGGKKA